MQPSVGMELAKYATAEACPVRVFRPVLGVLERILMSAQSKQGANRGRLGGVAYTPLHRARRMQLPNQNGASTQCEIGMSHGMK
jgi:hypothetical protein